MIEPIVGIFLAVFVCTSVFRMKSEEFMYCAGISILGTLAVSLLAIVWGLLT